MKLLIASIAILGVLGLAVGMAVQADEIVTATVTPQIIAVTVTDGSVDYGILAAAGTADTNTLSSEEQTITNNSNVSADIQIKSGDAISGGTDWELVASGSVGTDTFGHQYDINDSASWTDFPTDNSYTASPVVTLDASGGADNDATLDLKILMPLIITDTAPHSIDVTVLATAS